MYSDEYYCCGNAAIYYNMQYCSSYTAVHAANIYKHVLYNDVTEGCILNHKTQNCILYVAIVDNEIGCHAAILLI